ncbi:MAG: alpha/beta hydrolase [Isosphaera sp.]|nr:alpha/beta hydrolase [Isosphaera sp.]
MTLDLPGRGAVAYDDAGAGLPVVLLHAFPFDRGMWQPQLGPLSAAGFRVLAPDLPGFGGSAPGPDPFTVDGAADFVAAFLDWLKVDRAVVGGLSMGGYVALAFARRHPGRLAGLVLADTRAAPEDDTGRAARDQAVAAVEKDGPAKFGEGMLAKVLSDHTREANPAAVELARTVVTRQAAATVVAGLRALRDRPDAAPGLAAVAVPTLVLVGEHDAVTPPLNAARLAGSVRGSELLHVPGAGHLSNLENPAEFNRAVVAFLRKV